MESNKPPARTCDFFVSHSSADRDWAEWIAWQLEKAGYSTLLDVWDFAPGKRFTREMQDAHADTARTIAVLSPDYFASKYAQLELEARLVENHEGDDQRLIPIVVRKCKAPGLLRPFIHINLTSRTEAAAVKTLLEGLPVPPPPKSKARSIKSGQRRKPEAAPPFPAKVSKTRTARVRDDFRLSELPDQEQFKGTDEELYSIAFSPDNQWVAAGSEKKVLLWKRSDPKNPILLKKHKSFVYSVAFSGDSRFLATGCEDHFVRLWDIQQESLVWAKEHHDDAVYSVAISRDGKLLASGSYDQSVKVWDAASGQLKFSYGRRGNVGRITSVAFAPNGKTIAFGSLDNTIQLWELGKGEAHLLGEHSSSVEAIAFSPRGDLLASCGLDKSVRVWDVAKRKVKWQGVQHQYLVRSVAFSPDGATLASAGWDKMVYLWDVQSGTMIQELPFDPEKPWHKDWIWSVAYSPDGTTLASSGSDGKVILWRVEAATPETLD